MVHGARSKNFAARQEKLAGKQQARGTNEQERTRQI